MVEKIESDEDPVLYVATTYDHDSPWQDKIEKQHQLDIYKYIPIATYVHTYT